MILIIAEKPSVGRDIAKVLKCTKKNNGYIEGGGYTVSWALGHLVTLWDPQDYAPTYKKWDYKSLPIIPEEIKLKAIKKTKAQLDILKKLMNQKETEKIICATDSGREGELIFRYIYEFVGCKKPFSRLWISSMTDTAILNGFKNLKESSAYDHLYTSAKCRSEADWLVGINASRAYTVTYGALLSIGRVQTPTLAMIVQRQKEIDIFVPQDYFEVETATLLLSEETENSDKSFKGIWTLPAPLLEKPSDAPRRNETKIYEKQKADEIVKKVKHQEGNVISVEEEEKRQPPPLLYDLTELQRDANKKFSYSASKTLSIAQDLYEKRKMITYPRTDSRYLSTDMIPKIKTVLTKLKNITLYASYASGLLTLEALPLSKRIVDDTKVSDHHAIIPTDGNLNLNGLSPDEFNIFNLIVQRFLAIFFTNYVYTMTKVVVGVKGEHFLSKGTVINSLGWREIYKNDGEKEEDEILPPLSVGDAVYINDAKCLHKKTKPPRPYTEASLLSAMENAGRFVEDPALKEKLKESGLGTPATRAAIIERLIQVHYIVRKGKNLIPTEKGVNLVEAVPAELKSPETTGKWEKGLSSIAKGTMHGDRFMESIKRYVRYIIHEGARANENIVFEKEAVKYKGKSLGKCPLCKQGAVLENTKAFYCAHWKQGCGFTIWKNSLQMYGVQLEGKLIGNLLKQKTVKINAVLPQTGEKCTGELLLNEKLKSFLEMKNLNRE